MEKALGCYVQVQSPFYQAAQCNLNIHAYFCIHNGDKSGLRKPNGQAPTLIPATTSAHLPKLVRLTNDSDSTLTYPIGKEGVQDWSM